MLVKTFPEERDCDVLKLALDFEVIKKRREGQPKITRRREIKKSHQGKKCHEYNKMTQRCFHDYKVER